MAVKRASKVDRELEALQAGAAEPGPPQAAAAVAAALASAHARVVVAAAALVRARGLPGLEPALGAAYRRFLGEDAAKRDPGCQAKLKVLEALDFGESLDPEPFLAAASLVQLEAAWGPPVDTAAPCRARALLALSRLGHPDLVVVAGPLLADPEAQVRASAAEALAEGGVRHAAGALLLKVAVGDDDPLVLLACMTGVLTLAPEVALQRFAPWLEGKDEQRRELAAVCLGQSSRPEVLPALLQALERAVLPAQREPVLKGLGLHRSEGALTALLEVVRGEREGDARAALVALAPRRFEPGLRARVEAAVAGEPELERALAQAFREA